MQRSIQILRGKIIQNLLISIQNCKFKFSNEIFAHDTDRCKTTNISLGQESFLLKDSTAL